MISEEVNSLPSKSRSLRAKSIAKRLATEKNQIESNNNTTKPRIKRSSNSSKHHTMSKYRRKVANAKERERMKLVSEAFDRLSNVVPVYKMMTANNSNVIPQDEIIPNAQVNDNKNPVTKVSTLRCAIDYINSLQRLIEDSNRGVLDPALYAMDDDDEDDENENKMSVTNNKNSKSKKDGSKGKKGQKSKKSKKRSSSSSMKLNHSNNNKFNNKKNKNFKVRQYHASDFRSKTNIGGNGKSNKSNVTLVAATRGPPMSKAQLNLAIAKGLQNCKPIYTPPPPSAKKTTTITQPQPLNFPTQPLQLIQLRPLNMTSSHHQAAVVQHVGQHAGQQAGQLDSSSSSSSTTDAETASLQSESDYLMMPSLEVFLQPQPSPTSSSTSSMTASSPVSSGGSSDGGFTTILEESHILDDIQAVLMDADNFDILV